ncbi:hypothetical protein Q8A73_017942 [Channa argus]|nr:hypothetical protein Q8A73_017942 [Channa argus]
MLKDFAPFESMTQSLHVPSDQSEITNTKTHKNHSIRPIDEAARDIKEGLQEQLEPLRNKLDLFNDMKENYGQTAKDIEERHKNHSIRPIDEAARDIKDGLRERLKPLLNKLDLFNDMKEILPGVPQPNPTMNNVS